MQTFERAALPTATAREHRLRLFQPTRRPHPIRDQEIVTPWGRVIITGRLGQSHADLLDSICYHAERRADIEGGRIKLLVDPAKVRRACRLGGAQIEKLARELREATVQIKEPAELACIGGLIDHIDIAVKADGTQITRANPLGGERPIWRVELGKALCRLVQKDVWIGYDPEKIAALTHGVSQALARHALTHKHQPAGGWGLDKLIHAVAGSVSDKTMRDRRLEVRRDAANLAALGLLIEGSKVRRVEQMPGSVEQMPGSVEQMPGASSKCPAVAGSPSGTPEGAGA